MTKTRPRIPGFTPSLRLLVRFLLAAFAVPASAQSAAPDAGRKSDSPEKIVVTGSNLTSIDQRRLSTAAKIIVGREEIEEFGDSTVADVLKRLPGVTIGGRPGRGGEIRMRGMGSGYTLVLINGERIPQGFSIDSLTPDQIERIEIMRAPTAEFGARAIAGTINIVLREALQKHLNDLRLGTGVERGKLQPLVSWTLNDLMTDGGAYNFTLSAFRNHQLDDTTTLTSESGLTSGAAELLQSEFSHAETIREGMHLTSRIQLPQGNGDSLTLQPFLVYSKSHALTDTQLVQEFGDNAPPYASSASYAQNQTAMGRINTQWQKRLGKETRLNISFVIGDALNTSDSYRLEYDPAGATSRTLVSHSRIDDFSWNTKGKISHSLAQGDSLVGGWEVSSMHRKQNLSTLQDGLPQPQLATVGDNLRASSQLLAVYAQDEWDLNPHWSAYAGLRSETIATDSAAANYATQNRSSVWTPLLHAVWKPDEAGRDRVRMSLTRSYKAPTLAQLSGLPSLSIKANNADAPDSVGNPSLKPELATGVEFALERYLSSTSLLNANFFYREIHNLIRTVTTNLPVSWSPTPRWVAMPQNFGTAMTSGIELEAKLRLSEVVAGALPVNIKTNISIFHSRVDQVPGPNNRLDQQPKAVANLGGDYRFSSLPLTLGGNYNWTPATTIQATALQSSFTSTKAVADVYALWVFSPVSQLRLSANNFLPRDYNSGKNIVVPSLDQLQTTQSIGSTHAVISARWELKI